MEGRRFDERLGALEAFIYRTDGKIVARDYGTYPKKVEDGEVSQIERSPRRLGFKLSHVRF